MPVYGQTQIYLMMVSGTMAQTQDVCRLWELRGFEVLSVSADEPGRGPKAHMAWVITARASSTLYVNWLMNDTAYQTGPYDGQQEAEAAERHIIMHYGLDKVKDTYVTAQRDHQRIWIGATE